MRGGEPLWQQVVRSREFKISRYVRAFSILPHEQQRAF